MEIREIGTISPAWYAFTDRSNSTNKYVTTEILLSSNLGRVG